MEKKLDVIACHNVDFVASKTQMVYADVLDACNYSCPYCCAAHFRVGRDRKLDLEVFSKWLSRVADPDRNLTVQILGGEPTLHPQLLGFCQENPGFHKNVFTNFSASLDTYLSLLDCQDIELTLSYHTTDASSPEKFFEKWKQIPDDKIGRVFVSVMAENETFAESKRAFGLLYQGFLDRKIQTQNLDVSLLLSSKTHHVSYTSEQLREYDCIHDLVVHKDYERYSCKLASGQTLEMSEDELFEQLGSDYFHGWLCGASRDCFYVSAGGEVYDCPMCHAYAGDSQRYVVGNVYSDKLPKRRQIICPFRYYCNMPELPKKKLFNFA